MEQAATRRFGPLPMDPGMRVPAREITGLWLWLLAGIAWGVIALVILQFGAASITTVGVLVAYGPWVAS